MLWDLSDWAEIDFNVSASQCHGIEQVNCNCFWLCNDDGKVLKRNFIDYILIKLIKLTEWNLFWKTEIFEV